MTTQPGQESGVVRGLVAVLEGHGLTVVRRNAELVVYNSREPERGCVHVEYRDEYVSRQRVAWDYLGTLDGPDSGDEGGPHVTVAGILAILGVREHQTPARTCGSPEGAGRHQPDQAGKVIPMPASGEPSAVESLRARNAARKRAGELLAGTGFEIRERANELVIVNPRNRDAGQIHVSYADGRVSWSRTIWDQWGFLAGYKDDIDPADTVGLEKIIGALTASPAAPSGPP